MTDLFLRRVELSNFRLYGDSYIFDFDTEPGVTLVVGANGLGKTTLFDGIEWALTGDVSRFSDFPGDGRRRERDPLTRLGQPEGSHRVGLQFNEGAPIDRGQGREPSEVQIASLLGQPGWAEIGDLHRYLSITHFLGQAASMRFSVRKPKEQWEALKGPAGVDRINYAKERLGGQAARQAFTRVVRRPRTGSSSSTPTLRPGTSSWQSVSAWPNSRYPKTLSRRTSSVEPEVIEQLRVWSVELAEEAEKAEWNAAERDETIVVV